MSWKISKDFNFCYGHRVWSQKLDSEYATDTSCKCRHLHGHEGLVSVYLSAEELTDGMVTDFKHLGWLKEFIDEHIDHQFIVDINDPGIEYILPDCRFDADAKKLYILDGYGNTIEKCVLEGVYVPNTNAIAGYEVPRDSLNSVIIHDVSKEREEILEGLFFVDMVPTSENLSKWLFDVVDAKMQSIATVEQITWNETPKSQATYERTK